MEFTFSRRYLGRFESCRIEERKSGIYLFLHPHSVPQSRTQLLRVFARSSHLNSDLGARRLDLLALWQKGSVRFFYQIGYDAQYTGQAIERIVLMLLVRVGQ
jgi:hypothetical protein